MKKFTIILFSVGAAALMTCAVLVYTVFRDQSGSQNAMYFVKTVRARITDTRTVEVRREKKVGGKYMEAEVINRRYYVNFFVTDIDGSQYDMEISVTAEAYAEYEKLEKNKDMDVNMYRNDDSLLFLSLKDAKGAQEDYPGITWALGKRMIAALIFFAVGWISLNIGWKRNKKAKEEEYQ